MSDLVARKQELRRLLADVARSRGTITYNELATQLNVETPQRIHRLAALLEETMQEDHAAGRPLIASMVVSRSGEGLPQRGYFHMLGELRRYTGPDSGEEAVAAHRRELELAWEHYGRG